MPGNQSQPTFLVKKSDGTSVRLTLSEIDQLKERHKKVMPAMPKSPAPVRPAVAATNTDFSSLLEEVVLPSGSVNIPASRLDQADALIKKCSFTLPPTKNSRLRTVIQLLLKDVRTVDQTRAALVRSEREGGVGLEQKQAEEVLKLVKPESPARAIVPPPLKKTTVTPASVALASEAFLPQRRPDPPFPSVSTPFNAFLHEGQVSAAPRPVAAPSFKLAPRPASQPTMHDVVEKPLEMTPVDEIRYFSLVDFRRLSGNPAEAARRLQQKFTNVREESIVFYLEALAAWRQSPLYHNYLTQIESSLGKGENLATSAVGQAVIQPTEIKALVTMEQELPFL